MLVPQGRSELEIMNAYCRYLAELRRHASLVRMGMSFLLMTALVVVISERHAGAHTPKRHASHSSVKPIPPLSNTIAHITPSIMIVHARYSEASHSSDLGEGTDISGTGKRIVGTGFCIRADGVIATARHNIVGGDVRVGVWRTDGYHSVPATIIAEDEGMDVALIKIKDAAPPLMVTTDRPMTGADIATLGFPFGPTLDGLFVPTASAGIVGAVRPVKQSGGYVLQIHLLVDQGSSGAPIFYPTTGEVCGMVIRQLTTRDNSPVSAGYAVPSSVITALLKRIASKHTK